ncbi:hypothetical protein KKG08_03185 [Patescibacteria group bacterium]|nr:hypothetical protein [Patescibacteria group bacterium]
MIKLPTIKRIIVSLILAIESFIVVSLIKNFIQTQNYFSVSWDFAIKLILILVFTMYTLALTTVTANKWTQNLWTAAGISLGIIILLATYDMFYATIVGLGSFAISVLSSQRSLKLSNNMIKTAPRHTLRYSVRGVLLAFSICAATIFLLESSGVSSVNIGQKIAEVAEEPVKGIVESQIPKEIPQLPVPIEGFDISSLISPDNIDVKGIIESQVNRFLEPYKRLFSPVMALLIFLIIHFYGTIAYYIYFLTVEMIFSLLKKIGLLKVEKIQVEKEQLSL